MKMRRMIATGRLAKGSAACLLIVLALGGCRSGARTTVAGDGAIAGPSALAPDPALQRLLDPRPAPTGLSWLGGDVAASVALSEERYVWIFGDTILGSVSERCAGGVAYCNRRVAGDPKRGMIPNSVGVMTRGEDGSFAPLATFWRTTYGQPRPIFEAAEADEFLWPLAAVRVGDRLLIIANRHTRASGLYALGNVFVRVRNPHDRPDTWVYTRHDVPNVVDYTRGPTPLTWSTALVPAGRFIYVFGEHGVGLGARSVLARLHRRGLGAAAWTPALEYLLDAADGGAEPVWSGDFDRDRLHELDGLPGTSEAVLTFDDRLGWHTFQILPLSFDVRLYTAPALAGPWRDRGIVYRIPAPWRTARGPCAGAGVDCPLQYAAYAVKAHPELAPPGGVALSYNVNVSDGSGHAAVRAAERVHGFYVPRMISGTIGR
jgi:hypothetical protein